MKMSRKHARGFSLIELVIVVVIIAIIGAIAIPKMSRGAQGAGDSALLQDLSILRSAVDLYNSEHPTAQMTASFTATNVTDALLKYSDNAGTTFSATKTATCIYGPYLKAVPNAPVGVKKGLATILVGASADGTTAWLFTGTDFKLNDSTTTDATGAIYGATY